MAPWLAERPVDTSRAERVALAAGAALLELRRQAEAEGRHDPAALRAAGDAAAQRAASATIDRLSPGDHVLSEEAPDDPSRVDAERVWIVDPLDGTREFAERAADGAWRTDFAVHVALWHRDHGLVAGAVALPARDVVHTTASPPRAAVARTGAPRLAVSRTRPPEIATSLAHEHGWELVAMGSAGVKIMAVVTGEVDAYVHAGGQYEWDSAAPVAVARAAGMVCTRLDGSPLEYNRASPWLPDLVVSRPGVHDDLRAAIDAELGRTGAGAVHA
ncbi:3'(2'),5'-bisphosphate nucleotidase [Sediminihabitans luteus]|uniref:3'(2'),5'-bisphosphate nucleotidase n=1 Tax=Sediminihabitans luteus TaxID=1138585 RepID=A0A2M9CE78_9CELL|nr:inositol monophosphatase family protein [Sediminihabitans luteus]PJJ70160.1 3'(2'),5'-bisphosphate nucleotidase [Sediminihabitans luteus]GII97631.1 hypothetical protein Slu03_00090 [Sediminihabitans luteus]